MKGFSMVQRSHVPRHMVDEIREEEEDGTERGSGAIGQEEEGEVRPWMRDPTWLCLPNFQQDRREVVKTRGKENGRTEGQHLLRASGATIWCLRCACFAALRHGKGLKSERQPRRNNPSRIRIARLQAGLHPLTGSHL